MRVNEHNTTGASAAEAGRAHETNRVEGGLGSTAATSRAGGDRVELSSTSAAVSRAMAAHHSDRAAKVHDLAAQYQRGQYRVDNAATSRGLVSEAVASLMR